MTFYVSDLSLPPGLEEHKDCGSLLVPVHSCSMKRVARGMKPLPAEEIIEDIHSMKYPCVKLKQRMLHFENKGLLLPVSIYYMLRYFIEKRYSNSSRD